MQEIDPRIASLKIEATISPKLKPHNSFVNIDFNNFTR